MTRTPEQHLAAIRAALPQCPVERMSVQKTHGRTLAEEVLAPQDSPSFDNSQMDGYALAEGHLEGGEFGVGLTIAAGRDPAEIYPDGLGDELAPVMTGAAVPDGTVAVVPVERCEPADFVDSSTVHVPATPRGQFVRVRGSDLARGDVLFRRGHVVNERTVGAATLMGIDTLPVVRPARVIVCTGGEEIGGAGPAHIPDANSPLLHTLCSTHHIEVATHVRTSDSPAHLDELLHEAIAEHQPTAVITSGGISHGKYEVVRQVLEPHDGWFGHVSMQPGGPQGFAEFDGVPVVCLPGNPISTAVSFRLFVAPALGEAAAPFEVIADEQMEGLDGKTRFLRGRVRSDQGVLRASVVGGAGSHLLAQSVEANVLLEIPEGRTLAAGDVLWAYSI